MQNIPFQRPFMGNDRRGGFPRWFSPFARSAGVALRGGDIVATSLLLFALLTFANKGTRERGGNGDEAWLPDGYSLIFRSYVFDPSGLKDYGPATLHYKI